MKINFEQTCSSCPEQYDAYLDNDKAKIREIVGYLRLRHGEFTVAYPDVRGEIIYYYEPEGADGSFVSDAQRDYYLFIAQIHIGVRLALEKR